MKSSMKKAPGWIRGVQIGLGVITVILSILALVYPLGAFRYLIVLLSIVLFIVGIEKIITGIFLPIKGRWATIGLGILVLIFAGLAISYPGATAVVVTTFIGLALLFNGIARIVEGLTGKHSGWARAFLVGVGILTTIIGSLILVYPLFGTVLVAVLVVTIIAIGLLITGIQMIAVGAAGRKMMPDSSVTK